MTAADRIDRQFTKLLVADADGAISHLSRAALASMFRPGDLVVANDAATLPASLQGVHCPTGEPIEARLAGWLSFRDPSRFVAVVFGAGDHRMLTEDRPPPPPLSAGDSSSSARSLRRSNACSTIRGSYASVSLAHPLSIVRGLSSARSADPVRAYSRAAQAVGRLDENRGRTDCLRGAIGGICARLANPQGLARAGRRFRDPLTRGRSVVDGRRRPRPAASLRRILSHSGGVRVGRSRPRSRGQGASSRLGRVSSGRSNPPPTPTGPCVRERAERADASLAARRSVLWMRSSPASINPVKATTSYSERSLTTGCSTVCVLPLKSETIAPMSLEIRC